MAATQISDLQSIYKSQYKINRNASIRPQRPKSFSIYTDYPPWGPSLPINPKGKSPNLTKMAATLVSGLQSIYKSNTKSTEMPQSVPNAPNRSRFTGTDMQGPRELSGPHRPTKGSGRINPRK